MSRRAHARVFVVAIWNSARERKRQVTFWMMLSKCSLNAASSASHTHHTNIHQLYARRSMKQRSMLSGAKSAKQEPRQRNTAGDESSLIPPQPSLRSIPHKSRDATRCCDSLAPHDPFPLPHLTALFTGRSNLRKRGTACSTRPCALQRGGCEG